MDVPATAEQRASALSGMNKQQLIAMLLRQEYGLDNAAASCVSRKATATASRPAKRRNKRGRDLDWSQYRILRVALRLAYIGERYRGLALQNDGVDDTVEEQVLQALETAKLIRSRETCNISKCGRTDKGVSALGNVLSIDLRSLAKVGVEDKPACEYMRVLNGLLPKDIRITGAVYVGEDFSARFHCSSRTYKYLFFKDDLDTAAMQTAADMLLGLNDYRNLCKMDVRNMQDYVRCIVRAEIAEAPEYGAGASGRDAIWCFTVEGTGFLYHQVRCMMAILFMVGQGLEKPDIVGQLLDVEKNPCRPDYSMASEVPLVLFSCQFPGIDFDGAPSDSHVLESELLSHLKLAWRRSCVSTAVWSMFAHTVSGDVASQQGLRCPTRLCQLEHSSSVKVHCPLMNRSCGKTFEQQVALLSEVDRKRFEEKRQRTQSWRQQQHA